MRKEGDFHGIVAFTLILTILTSFLVLSSIEITGMSITNTTTISELDSKIEGYYSFTPLLIIIFITAVFLSGYFHISAHIPILRNISGNDNNTENENYLENKITNSTTSRFVYNSMLNPEKKNLEPTNETTLTNNHHETLNNYFLTHLNKGHSIENISSHLINFGWHPSIVDKIKEKFNKTQANLTHSQTYKEIKTYIYNSIKQKKPIQLVEEELLNKNIPLTVVHDLITQSMNDIKREQYKTRIKKETRDHRYNFKF
jgi:hypothetical protein